MGEQIVEGDWVVAGKIREERDFGWIASLDGDLAEVAWSGGYRTTLDLSDDGIEVYARRDDAEARMHELDECDAEVQS